MRKLLTSLPLTPLLVLTLWSCRPSGYTPPPQDPNEPPRVLRVSSGEGLSEESLAHTSLFGEDSAPPSTLTPPRDALITPTGLASTILRPGTGKESPKEGDNVVMHYVGWDRHGVRFDSTIARGQPERRALDSLIPGWREALEYMVVGEKRRMWIPERLAFGAVPAPGQPAGDLMLEVELLEIKKPPAMPETPKHLDKAPADARSTLSGVRYVVQTKGSGERRPTREDRVLVHYTGWSKNGNVFDSSVARGEPVAFGVTEVIAGWTEMLLLMHEGERVRVWIPSKLAYGDNPGGGKPGGDLIFDIELIEIQ